ncbi:MAG TPA: substrate-binding domain-containing protein [Pseudonocardiaceae bacterium]|nr:substrate-binding domain-containing protein [Pseudonocardiaceae bacterium]
MSVSAEQRRRRILEIVQEQGSIRVMDLAEGLGVAPVTARRDVALLADQGLLQHGYGSASWPERTPAYLPVPVDHARTAAGGPGETFTIGMLVPSATYYYAEVVRGAQAAAAAAGARLVLGITGYRPAEDETQVARLLEAGADGLLLTPSWEPEGPTAAQLERFDDLKLPCVLVERRAASMTSAAGGWDRVCSDHAYGAFLAVRQLASLGHRRIALAAHRSPAGSGVRSGYFAALEALDLGAPAVEPIDTYSLETNPVGFDTAADRLLDAVRTHGVTAALIHNDVDAIMLIQRLRTLDVRVPDDLSVIAYDDEVAAYGDTPLSAVKPPKREVGQAAVEILLERLGQRRRLGVDEAARTPRRHLDLLPHLTARESCQPLVDAPEWINRSKK